MTLSRTDYTLIQQMSDGAYHSGESLGALLGVSRAAIWKHLQRIAELGIKVERKPGLGYRIEGGLSLLNPEDIARQVAPSLLVQFDPLEVYDVIPSTNQYLMERIQRTHAPVNKICFAEMQTAGKGRRGRQWQSPFARNIYLSIARQFQDGAKSVEGLSLAAGLAAVQVLESFGCRSAKLKWPNDVLVDGKKLAGVLIEITGDLNGLCHVVLGVGFNVAMPDGQEAIDQPWTDLDSALGHRHKRSEVAGKLLSQLLGVLVDYPQRGFASYRAAWEQRCAFLNQPVAVSSPSSRIEGVMLGVSDAGALRLRVQDEEREFAGGELSLRSSA